MAGVAGLAVVAGAVAVAGVAGLAVVAGVAGAAGLAKANTVVAEAIRAVAMFFMMVSFL